MQNYTLNSSTHSGGVIIANRISIIGSLVAAFGFFFLPLIEIRPNRLASGLNVNLFEIQGDFRYLMLFALALVPLIIALQKDIGRRGWALVGIGNLVMILTLLLPADAGALLLAQAETLFEEGTRISNPRVFTSSAMAVGLLGGYIILFGGVQDLRKQGTHRFTRLGLSLIGFLVIVAIIVGGSVDIYSILVEFSERGETLSQRFVEHFIFIVVSLIAGLVVGISMGLWAARDERMSAIILYTVGIIQTVPSLALFGVLLVPLARLGDQTLADVLVIMVAGLSVGIGLNILSILLDRIKNNPELTNRTTPALIVTAGMSIIVPIIVLFVAFVVFAYAAVVEIAGNPNIQDILENGTTALSDRFAVDSFATLMYVILGSFAIGVALNLLSFFLDDESKVDSPTIFKAPRLIYSVILLFLPLIVFIIMVVTVGFEAAIIIGDTPGLIGIVGAAVLAISLSLGLAWYDRRQDPSNRTEWTIWAQRALLAGAGIGFVYAIFNATGQITDNTDFNEQTLRDLGVSGIGTAPALIALTLYSLLPLVRNTYAGLNNIDPAIIDSGKGMGMTPSQIFFQIELPLAFPIIMAGVRSAGISLVGITAVASIIGAGALGDFILLGVNTTSIDLILLGAIPAVVLAVILDALLQIIENILTSPGIKQVAS